jgi:hypothetical protein
LFWEEGGDLFWGTNNPFFDLLFPRFFGWIPSFWGRRKTTFFWRRERKALRFFLGGGKKTGGGSYPPSTTATSPKVNEISIFNNSGTCTIFYHADGDGIEKIHGVVCSLMSTKRPFFAK